MDPQLMARNTKTTIVSLHHTETRKIDYWTDGIEKNHDNFYTGKTQSSLTVFFLIAFSFPSTPP